MKPESSLDGNSAVPLVQTVVCKMNERERTQTTKQRENLLNAGDTCRNFFDAAEYY